jgi:prepilin-type N-terminal cleavage/methylation domain-containing protein
MRKFLVSMKSKAGFTLVELVIVMAVIALILSIAIPNFRAMQREGEYTKVEGDLDTLKIAITSFWRHNSQAYPANVHAALTGATPSVITKNLSDPWKTDATNVTYGFAKGTDATFGDWFYTYTKGPNGDTSPSFNATNQRVEYAGSGRVISNAPVVKQ